MLRELISNGQKAVDTMLVADVAMVRGMGVQKTDTEAILPTAKTCENIYLVANQTDATGLLSVQGELSEYTADFENIAVGQFVRLITPQVGERYATNQYATAKPAKGDYLMVGTDGLFVTAVAEDTSKFLCTGDYNDAGHACIKFDVVEPHKITA